MPEFTRLGNFLRFLSGLAVSVEAAQQRGREAAAEIVRHQIVVTLAEYQEGDTGPFPARAALRDATLVAAGRHGLGAGAPELETGALLGSISAMVEQDGRAAVGVADEIVGSGALRSAERAADAFVRPVIAALCGTPPSNGPLGGDASHGND